MLSQLTPDAGRKFQSTPPARGATMIYTKYKLKNCISIHAPREGGDYRHDFSGDCRENFNPRPPRGGRPCVTLQDMASANFNPRPPRGGRQEATAALVDLGKFQSTPPARGATRAQLQHRLADRQISIHAPREGGDCCSFFFSFRFSNFNPRPPRGGRPGGLDGRQQVHGDFNPRPPRGGRHQRYDQIFATTKNISIHAPREGGDQIIAKRFKKLKKFQSTPPARGATHFRQRRQSRR